MALKKLSPVALRIGAPLRACASGLECAQVVLCRTSSRTTLANGPTPTLVLTLSTNHVLTQIAEFGRCLDFRTNKADRVRSVTPIDRLDSGRHRLDLRVAVSWNAATISLM